MKIKNDENTFQVSVIRDALYTTICRKVEKLSCPILLRRSYIKHTVEPRAELHEERACRGRAHAPYYYTVFD